MPTFSGQGLPCAQHISSAAPSCDAQAMCPSYIAGNLYVCPQRHQCMPTPTRQSSVRTQVTRPTCIYTLGWFIVHHWRSPNPAASRGNLPCARHICLDMLCPHHILSLRRMIVSCFHGDSHVLGSALNDLHSCLHCGGVQIRHLSLRNLLHSRFCISGLCSRLVCCKLWPTCPQAGLAEHFTVA